MRVTKEATYISSQTQERLLNSNPTLNSREVHL